MYPEEVIPVKSLYERVEKFGGMIKTARISFLHPGTEGHLIDGASMNIQKPIINGEPLRTGMKLPVFESKMLSNSPYKFK